MTRLVDRGAVFAGWVGFGMALLVAISFELIVAVQSLVFLFATIGGLLIGFYANARSERRRPWHRVLANAAWAATVTALSLAILYAGIRLLFIYADGGYPGFNRVDRDGRPIPPFCQRGPDCTYQRYLAAGRGPDLERGGVSGAAVFERYLLAEERNGALVLIGLTLAGGLAGGAGYALAGTARGRDVPAREPSAG